MLIPATLLSRYTLELAGAAVEGSTGTDETGTESVGGRAAHRVVARPRLIADRRPEKRPDQVVVHVDAELGILLRREESLDGEPLEVIELSGVRSGLPKAVDPGQFQPPSGVPVEEAQIPFSSPGVSLPGLGGDAVRAAAGVTATAIGFAVRHWPSPGRPAGDEAARQMPGRGGPTAEGLEPADDDLINLLHRTGRAAQAFTAEVHEWLDGDFVTRAIARGREFLPPARDGILGPDAVWDALASRAETTYKVIARKLKLGIVLRVESFAGGRPVMCYEMRELVPGIPDPHVFEVPHGARRSGPLEGFGLLSPANAVKGAAGLGAAGAAALVGWLQKRPRS